MVPLQQLIWDVDGSLAKRSDHGRARTLSRIADLFEGGAHAFTPEQIELFDVVIGRFAAVIETRARVELAERLARLGRAPPGILRHLARDVIVVARPILAGSGALDDQDLMAVALECGRDHMLAICERAALSSAVTDILVHKGDGVVRHAVVGNPGAAFSGVGAAALIGFAREDAALLALLGERRDLPGGAMEQLIAIAKERARLQLGTGLQSATTAADPSALNEAARRLGAPAGPIRLADNAAPDEVGEADVARAAEAGLLDETIALTATLTGLSPAGLARIFDEPESDLLIVIGRARGWRWATVRALLQLRDPTLTERHHFRRAAETFDTMSSVTASSVVHFIKVREAVRMPPPRPEPGALRFA